MSLHFPGFDFFGITPMWLTCTSGMDWVGNGPSILPFATSVARYSEIISGWSLALGRLLVAGAHVWEE